AALAHVFIVLRKLDVARAEATHVLELAPASPTGHELLAAIALESGKWREAESSARRALERDPESVAAINALGTALTRQGRAKEAVGLLRDAARADPTFEPTRRNLFEAVRTYREAGALVIAVLGLAAMSIIKRMPA